ncbi:hypothetical protein AB0H77_15450 [Streptomyces sp. NPDC050844]|uniref:hypothetical protein n=1 Tax=Streptomyces sp. NPDC050844 TaxID=3155790 RepID=UPI0033F387B9
MNGQTREALAYTSLAVGITGFTRFGWCLVYLICDAEHLAPRCVRESAALERTALAVLLAWDRARLAAVKALLSLLLLAAPKGAIR